MFNNFTPARRGSGNLADSVSTTEDEDKEDTEDTEDTEEEEDEDEDDSEGVEEAGKEDANKMSPKQDMNESGGVRRSSRIHKPVIPQSGAKDNEEETSTSEEEEDDGDNEEDDDDGGGKSKFAKDLYTWDKIDPFPFFRSFCPSQFEAP